MVGGVKDKFISLFKTNKQVSDQNASITCMNVERNQET